MMNIKDLTKPFSPDSIHWRIGRKSKAKDKATALAYIDARDVMDRLDECVGVGGWTEEYSAEPPRSIRKQDYKTKESYIEQICGRVTCRIGIKFGGEWICKSDAAGETNVEGEKGGFSDAFKRAAVKFGIGRDLYRLDASTWYTIDNWGNFTQQPQLPKWYMDKCASMGVSAKEYAQAEAKQEVASFFVEYNACLREHMGAVMDYKLALGDDDLLTAVGIWHDLPKDAQEIIQRLAPSKGGVLTTKERDIQKTNEWSTARNEYFKGAKQ